MKLTCALLYILLCHWAMAQQFTVYHNITCEDSTIIKQLGYPSWNPPKIIKRPGLGHAILLGDPFFENAMKYTAPPCLIGIDTVIIYCAKATQITCDTGIYIFNITCSSTTPDYTTHQLDCMDSIYVNNLNAFWQPKIITSPIHGFAKIIFEPTDGAGVLYVPNKGYEGIDMVKVSIGGKVPTLYIFNVYCDLNVKTNGVSNIEYNLFPNPTSEYLHLYYPHESAFFNCYDMHGIRIPLIYTTKSDLWQFNIKPLNSGIYFIEMNNQRKRKIFKFIKN